MQRANGSAMATANGVVHGNPKTKSYPRKQSRTSTAIKVVASIPKNRDTVNWCGWGFKDSGFCRINGECKFLGDRYAVANMSFPHIYEYLKDQMGIEGPENFDPRINPPPKEEEYPDSRFTEELLEDIRYLGIDVTTKGYDRLLRSGGQSFDEVWQVLDVRNLRIPDAVAWPTCHEECVELVQLAHEKNFVIIPYGGGSSVAGHLVCSKHEKRPILSVDTIQMNEILCVDRDNLLVTAESGIIGVDLEAALKKLGYTTGHDPDSLDMSTLGGWVSTRASGMKQSIYGNIEDLTIHMRIVTPSGVYEKGSKTERMSCGPDLNHLILGSEGMFGLITEVTVKIRPLPEYVEYGSALFPDYPTGLKFMREIAKRRLQAGNIRLMDEAQFQSGFAMRPYTSYLTLLWENVGFKYLEWVKGYEFKKICIMIMVHEGYKVEVQARMKRINQLIWEMGGMPIGSKSGKAGYSLNPVLLYIRDVAVKFNVIADAVEATIPWDRLLEMHNATRDNAIKEALKNGVIKPIYSSRISQAYDTGVCYYIQLTLRVPPGADILEIAHRVKHVVKATCIAHGGTISHHHGIGKQKRFWYEDFVSTPGANILRATKHQLDPKNIFGSRNFLRDYSIKKHDLENDKVKSNL